MTVIEVNENSFKSEVEESNIPVIVDFNADWCPPCQMMKPEFDALGSEYKGKLKFVSVDSDKNRTISSKFKIDAIPCLVIMSKGVEVDRIVGFMPKEALKEKIDNILSKI